MPDYKSMYEKLFNAITSSISMLQEVQRETEDMCISDELPMLYVLNINSDINKEGEDI